MSGPFKELHREDRENFIMNAIFLFMKRDL
jgi:hypothetical protein